MSRETEELVGGPDCRTGAGSGSTNGVCAAAAAGLQDGTASGFPFTHTTALHELSDVPGESDELATGTSGSGTCSEFERDTRGGWSGSAAPDAVGVRRRKTPGSRATNGTRPPASSGVSQDLNYRVQPANGVADDDFTTVTTTPEPRPLEKTFLQQDGSDDNTNDTTASNLPSPSSFSSFPPSSSLPSTPTNGHPLLRDGGRADDDPASSRHPSLASRSRDRQRKRKFADLVFTRSFSAFDRQNPRAAGSPFRGFYTLFWMGVFLAVVRIGADNWRRHGSPLGTNEIMRTMFGRDVVVLLLADGAMCALTAVSWALQLAVWKGWVDWDRAGWVVQHIWQTVFIAGVVGLTMLRDWPWTHTVFFVLHGLVMLMKQHSYAFYNGHLSTVHKQRRRVLAALGRLERTSPSPAATTRPSSTAPPASDISTSHLARVPSARGYEERRRSVPCDGAPDDVDRIVAAVEAGEPLDAEQVHLFARVLRWEADALSDELRGRAAADPARAYPGNLTLRNHCEYVVLPTVVYELEYPRSESIDWSYAAEKAAACAGVIFVMIMISQAFIYPVVMDTVRMKEEGVPLAGRFARFPWMLLDLIFPFVLEYLLAWYLIWETILNLLAELTRFADRAFYDAWWNCVSWDQFARDWNRPVHNFLLRHVYHSSISAMKVDRHTATLITFFLSACVHELVMWCIFKKLRGYLLFLQMCQLPLVRLSRTKWLRNRPQLGNIIFWLGICTGPSILCSLYLIL